MTLSADEINKLKHAAPLDGVLPVIHQRWSPRAFSSQPVSGEDLRRVFEAARWAASSNNEQPWRYLVGRHGSATHHRILESLAPFNQRWAAKAPVLILGLARARFSHNDSVNLYAVYDLGAASSYLTLQAAAIGLTTHQMAGFDRERARQLLAIPDGYEFGAVIALGYLGEPASLPTPELVEREIKPRERKALHDFVFSAWGEPLPFD
jgi:nitroreductase